MTASEVGLWQLLRKKQLKGRRFRRQHSIENFIVDFYCPKEKLIVELDGSAHDDIGSQNYDVWRDSRLSKLGFKVLRYENDNVFENPEGILEDIASHFKG